MADYNAPAGTGLTEREAARERLKQSLDVLAERANLQVQMQKEPVKMLGGASAVGAVLGLLIGTQVKRTKKIYVDAKSPLKHQQELVKAQKSQKSGGGVGGALLATLGTLAVKTLSDRVLAPKLEEIAQNMLEKSGEAPRAKTDRPRQMERSSSAGPSLSKPETPVATSGAGPRPMGTASASTSPSATAAFLKPASASSPANQTVPTDQAESHNVQAGAEGSAPPMAASHEHPGVVPTPKSVVEAKAQGSVIAPDEKGNPNLR